MVKKGAHPCWLRMCCIPRFWFFVSYPFVQIVICLPMFEIMESSDPVGGKEPPPADSYTMAKWNKNKRNKIINALHIALLGVH